MRDFLEVIEKYRTSLIPWYRSAEKQITESGEEDLYKELLDNIRKFSDITTSEERIKKILEEEKSKLGLPSKEERDEMKRFLVEKEEMERKIENVKSRYHEGQLDEKVFGKIIEEYEKQLVEIDVKIEILKGREIGKKDKEVKELEGGRIYLIKEKEPKRCIEIFLDETERYSGLWISRVNPEQIKSKYNLQTQNVSVLWLTDSVISEESVSPQIPQLFAVLTDFIEGDEKKVILLEGIEYLITCNGFDSVLNFIQGVKDKISVSNVIIIVTVTPDALSEKEMTLIEKEMQNLS